MSDPRPLWPYVVIVIAGVVLFFGAVWCLVMTVRATGFGQFYWAFNTLTVISVAGLLVSSFLFKSKND